MSWKDLKRFWRKPADTNALISEAFDETCARAGTAIMSHTTATALGYAIIESAETRKNDKNVIHLVIGSYNLWPSYFVASVLGRAGYPRQRVVVVVPKFLYSGLQKDILNIPALGAIIIPLRNQVQRDMTTLRKYNLASVYTYSYEYMFNWEYYDLDLSPGGYLIFDGVKLPVSKFYDLPGWKLKGKYSNLFFVSRDVYEDRSNDTNQSKEPENTEEDLSDPEG